jgi:hypothetical protein
MSTFSIGCRVFERGTTVQAVFSEALKRAGKLSESVNNAACLYRQPIFFPKASSFLLQGTECKEVYGPCSQMCNFMASILQAKGMTSSRYSYGLSSTQNNPISCKWFSHGYETECA